MTAQQIRRELLLNARTNAHTARNLLQAADRGEIPMTMDWCEAVVFFRLQFQQQRKAARCLKK